MLGYYWTLETEWRLVHIKEQFSHISTFSNEANQIDLSYPTFDLVFSFYFTSTRNYLALHILLPSITEIKMESRVGWYLVTRMELNNILWPWSLWKFANGKDANPKGKGEKLANVVFSYIFIKQSCKYVYGLNSLLRGVGHRHSFLFSVF